MRDNVAAFLRLMLVTDDALLGGRDPLPVVRAAVAGGVTSVQLRLKRAGDRELAELARRLVAALPVPVLVNDRPDVAIAAGAAGVHLGPGDVPVDAVRRIAPTGFVIGASVGGATEAAAARGADYWGVGPWRVTGTKSDAGAALGIAGFTAIVQAAQAIPCLAIGGVRPDDVPAVLTAGGVGVAVVSGLLSAADVEVAARDYARLLDERLSG
jgi:thiamine-phosphate pyrophosphorylase